MLHEYSEEAMEFFSEGKEAEYFRTPEECVDKIFFYKKNSNIAARIAEAGYYKIFKSKLTYTHLLKDVLKSVYLTNNHLSLLTA